MGRCAQPPSPQPAQPLRGGHLLVADALQTPSLADFYYTINHWSNMDSMKRYLEKCVQPYVLQHIAKLGLRRCSTAGLCTSLLSFGPSCG
jgi:hypothetical protein